MHPPAFAPALKVKTPGSSEGALYTPYQTQWSLSGKVQYIHQVAWITPLVADYPFHLFEESHSLPISWRLPLSPV